jgi:hypothetical protein
MVLFSIISTHPRGRVSYAYAVCVNGVALLGETGRLAAYRGLDLRNDAARSH